jgi:hypothetical protein
MQKPARPARENPGESNIWLGYDKRAKVVLNRSSEEITIIISQKVKHSLIVFPSST